MLPLNGIVGGTYQVIREIGHGGIGVVYLGYHLNLQKYIVLKRISTGVSDVHALRREADIMKNLHHTNIPQIYDFIVENGEVFTVMDYIEGRSLDQYVKGANGFSEKQLIQWFRELAGVLTYLHNRKPSVIHSDIKPENIIITPQGVPILIDFNISIDQNTAGKLIGISTHYASPEQYYMASELSAGRSVAFALDERTDIYSLGAVFYTLVTGLFPDSRVPVNRLQTTSGLIYSQAFLAVVDRCTEWDRNNRFKNARKMLGALNDLRKMDRRYRKLVLLRIAGWTCSVLLIVAGNYCLFHGWHVDVDSKVSIVADMTEIDDYEGAGEEARKILDNLASRIVLDGEKEAELCHVAGEAEYLKGHYASAISWYNAALDKLEKKDHLARYCSDLALSYLKLGDKASLGQVLSYCEKNGVSGYELELVRAAFYNQNGETEKCIATVDRIIEGNADLEAKAKACLTAAEAVGDESGDRIAYYKKATEYSTDKRYKRELARALLEEASESNSYSSEAARMFEELCNTRIPQTTDMINLGIAYYYAGEYERCISTMEKAEQKSEEYQIPLYLALASYYTGKMEAAREYSQNASVSLTRQHGSKGEQELLEALDDELEQEGIGTEE